MHGAVLVHKAPAQIPVLQRVELAAGIVAEQLLGQMEQRSQLAQSPAVGLHLRGIVLSPEKGAAVVGGDVTALVNDVKQTRLQDLDDKRGQSEIWTEDNTSNVLKQHFSRDTLKNGSLPLTRRSVTAQAPPGPPPPSQLSSQAWRRAQWVGGPTHRLLSPTHTFTSVR